MKVPDTLNPFLSTPSTPVYTKVYTVYTPKNAFSGDFDYALPIGGEGAELRLHLDASYADAQYSFQSESVKAQSSFIVNGRLALADIPMNANGTKATIALWGRNLFNETHIYRQSDANTVPVDGKYTGILGSYANFNPPRTFGIEGTVSF